MQDFPLIISPKRNREELLPTIIITRFRGGVETTPPKSYHRLIIRLHSWLKKQFAEQ